MKAFQQNQLEKNINTKSEKSAAYTIYISYDREEQQTWVSIISIGPRKTRDAFVTIVLATKRSIVIDKTYKI